MNAKSKNIGFGELTAKRSIIYNRNELQNILNGEKDISEIKPEIYLNFDDEDAIPFEYISLKLSQSEEYSDFFIGSNAQAHSSLINQAFKSSPLKIRNLPTDWRNNPHTKEIMNTMHFSYGGRIWHNKKLIVLKSYTDFASSVKIITLFLERNNIDISSYYILKCEKNDSIDERYWGDIYVYKVDDICKSTKDVELPPVSSTLHNKYEVKTKKLISQNGSEMTLAQYNSLIKQEKHNTQEEIYQQIINEVDKIVKKRINEYFD